MKKEDALRRVLLVMFYLLILSPFSAFGQSNSVSGTVLDEKNEPVIGAYIVESGTSNGTITDIDGKFTIKTKENANILISSIGYKSQSMSVAGKSVLNVVLAEDSKLLSEVVVTALGIKREEKALGYAVQNVAGDNLQTVKGVDMATSLTGRVAGLLVKNSTDFAAAPAVSIRGVQPILVIDGVPYANMTLSDIPADDIESMSVLKGSTAAALYGERAGGGAIMLTTKQGGKDQGISISVNSSTMFDAGFLAIPEKQGIYGRGSSVGLYSYNQDQAWGMLIDGSDQYQWDPVAKAYRTYAYQATGKDNFKNFLENSYITNNNVSVAHQGKNSSVRSSITWVSTKGQYPNSKFDKYTYQLGGDIKVDKFKLSSNVAYNKQSSPNAGFNGYTSYDPMYTLLIWTAPDFDVRDYKDYWRIKDEKQNFTYQDNSRQGGSLTTGHNNPYFSQYEKLNIINRDIFNASLSLSYDIQPWAKVLLRSGLDFYLNRQDIKISKDSYVSAGNTGPNGGWYGGLDGAYATGRNSGYSMNNDLIVTGDKTWGKFTLEGLLGGSIFYKKDDTMGANTVGGISIPAYFSLNASVDKVNTTTTISTMQTNSAYGRVGASWNSLVFLEGTFRNDWVSTLPASTRSYFYPSVSGSFIASELLPGTSDWLSLWRLRGSWTMAKKTPKIYETNRVFNVTSSAWGSSASALSPTTLPSTDVHPEAYKTFELGTQAVFLNNRLSIDITYYDKYTYDLLKLVDVSPATGFSKIFVNMDEAWSTRGWELALTGTPIKTKDWRWDLGANWSKSATYYAKLDEQYSDKSPWVKVGERTDAYVLKDYLRSADGDIIYSNGEVQFSNYNSNFGWAAPKFVWGANTSLSYKGFLLAIAVDGRVGGITNTVTESYLWNSGNHPNSLTDVRAKDVATPGSKNYVGDGVKVISGKATYDDYGNITSDNRQYAPNDIGVTYKTHVNRLHAGTAWGGNGRPADAYSTTFFKIREVSLSYNLPKSIAKVILAKEAAVSLVGQNVFLWAKQFKYSDPDGGTENFSDPSLRYLGFNVKLNF